MERIYGIGVTVHEFEYSENHTMDDEFSDFIERIAKHCGTSIWWPMIKQFILVKDRYYVTKMVVTIIFNQMLTKSQAEDFVTVCKDFGPNGFDFKMVECET